MKYKNKKIEFNGMKFDSKKEANRYQELLILQHAGQITELEKQVKFELIPSQKGGIRTERPMTYIADFVYWEDGVRVIEDCKGFKTKDYVIKRKLMKLQGYEITET